jgi:hypothetical protein
VRQWFPDSVLSTGGLDTQPVGRPDPEFLRQRQETIAEGFRKAIRREVARLRREGLPIYVFKDSKVVQLPPEPPVPDSQQDQAR